MDKFKIGDRIRLVKDRDNAKAGMVGTIVSDVECGDWGVKFDNKFYGGHALNGECKSGYGHWIAPEEMELAEEEPQFKAGQIYRVGNGVEENGNIIKISKVYDCNFNYDTVRGKATNYCAGCDSPFARSLALLTGKEIGEAIRKYDAEHSETGVREVKRHAKVGDTIKIINRDRLPSQYKVGKTYKVTEAETRSTLNPDGGVCVNKDFFVIGHQSYVVVSSGKHSYTAEQIAEAKRIVLDALKDLYQNCKGSIVFGTAETNSNIIRAYFFSKDKTLMRSEKGKRVSLEAHNVGYASAKCSSNDEPNEWIGKCVALCKALHKPIPAFIMGDGKGRHFDFEKAKAKGSNGKYTSIHCTGEQETRTLMKELETAGYKWRSGSKPTECYYGDGYFNVDDSKEFGRNGDYGAQETRYVEFSDCFTED